MGSKAGVNKGLCTLFPNYLPFLTLPAAPPPNMHPGHDSLYLWYSEPLVFGGFIYENWLEKYRIPPLSAGGKEVEGSTFQDPSVDA